MKQAVHRAVTEQALRDCFSKRGLVVIVAANLGQDSLRYQIGHAYFHYDENSFSEANRYVNQQHALIVKALDRRNSPVAWQAFGRLTHTVQDFYAHSNYIPLWLSGFHDAPPPPEQVEILEPALLASPELRSGRLYYPLEALTFIATLARYIIPLLPHDSHARMNIDGPERPYFAYAFAAALKRTRHEYDRIVAELPDALSNLFIDHQV
jgi:hypothetical protein